MSTVGGKFFYFAYGSNLLKQRLTLMNPSAVYKAMARLDNYKLCFSAGIDPEHSGWHGGSATIVEDLGSVVWGIVWELDNSDMKNLDRQESQYNAINIEVVSTDKETYACRTYQKNMNCDWDNRPSPHYKDVIIRGAIQNNLPEDYLTFLHQIEDNGYKGSLELYDKVMKQLNVKV